MTRRSTVSVLATALACALVMALVWVMASPSDRAESAPRAAAAAADEQDDPASSQGLGRGHGGHGAKAGKHAWKAAWQQLSPAQKEEKMAALAAAHTQGMKAWKECVAAAGDDTTKRAACVKPLPPGLAKKRS